MEVGNRTKHSIAESKSRKDNTSNKGTIASETDSDVECVCVCSLLALYSDPLGFSLALGIGRSIKIYVKKTVEVFMEGFIPINPFYLQL
jgi:hypothetical protein